MTITEDPVTCTVAGPCLIEKKSRSLDRICQDSEGRNKNQVKFKTDWAASWYMILPWTAEPLTRSLPPQ